MVSSVSPETEHTPAKVLTVSRESPPATAVRPGFEPTHHHVQHRTRRRRGRRQRDRRTWLRCPWAATWPGRATYRHLDRLEAAARPAGPGRASSRRAEPHISDQAPPVWRAPEGPEGTGGLRDRPLRAFRLACGDLAGGRALRRPEHQRRQSTTATGTATPRQAYKKPTSGSDVGLWWS